jgi:hypothetical protein
MWLAAVVISTLVYHFRGGPSLHNGSPLRKVVPVNGLGSQDPALLAGGDGWCLVVTNTLTYVIGVFVTTVKSFAALATLVMPPRAHTHTRVATATGYLSVVKTFLSHSRRFFFQFCRNRRNLSNKFFGRFLTKLKWTFITEYLRQVRLYREYCKLRGEGSVQRTFLLKVTCFVKKGK